LVGGKRQYPASCTSPTRKLLFVCVCVCVCVCVRERERERERERKRGRLWSLKTSKFIKAAMFLCSHFSTVPPLLGWEFNLEPIQHVEHRLKTVEMQDADFAFHRFWTITLAANPCPGFAGAFSPLGFHVPTAAHNAAT
jgi:hypothetical protein